MTMDPDADYASEYGDETTDLSEETDDCTYCLYRGDLEDKIPDKCTLTNGQSCRACGRQSEFLKRIAATKKLLDQLILEELETRVEINRFHDPIHRLPPEITSHIFRFTLPDFALQEKTEDWPADRGLPSETWVLTLGAVCQLWRDIAWSTSDLWSNVMLTLHSEPTPNKINIFQEWLERSKQLPLSIRLYLSEDCCWMEHRGSTSSPQIRAFGRILKNHSARWKDLSLQCNDIVLNDFTRAQNGAPLLKTLQLNRHYSSRGHGRAEFALGGTVSMPQPDHVVLLGFERFEDVEISWSNVTDVTIDRLMVEDCIQFLRTLPKLVTVRFQDICESGDISDSDDSSDGRDPISVPRILHHLRSLYISSSISVAAVLDIITLPSLVELSIHGHGARASDVISLDSTLAAKIIELLQRSSCPLTSFSFEKFRCHQQGLGLIDILYSLPSSVNDLQLDVQSMSIFRRRSGLPFLFDHLARAPTATMGMPSRSDLLPNLKTLKHKVYKEGPIPWGRLLNLLRPMSGKPRPFKKLTIVERDHVDGVPPLIFKGRKMKRSQVLDLIKLMEDGVDLFLPRRVSLQDLLALLED